MHAEITVNRKTTRNIFKYFLKSLQNDPEGPTYFGPFTPIYLHLKPTNSRAALCEDFTTLAIARNWGQRCLAQTAIVTYKQTLAAPAPAFFGLSVINCTV